MSFTVKKRADDFYLMTPAIDGDSEFWCWSKDIKNAHHFKTRQDAKSKIRELRLMVCDFKIERTFA